MPSLIVRMGPFVGIIVLMSIAASPARAANLFGVVSERRAAEMVEAAEQFHARWPGHQLVLRTEAQLAALSDAAVAALWHGADALLFAGVFGDQADRLARLLQAHPPGPSAQLLALHGDLGLTRASRLDGERVFAGLDEAALRALTTELGAAEQTAEARARLTRRYPAQARWIEARAYWQAPGVDDRAALMAWLLARAADDVKPPAPGPTRSVRFVRQGRDVSLDALPESDARRVVVLDYDAGRSATARIHEALCESARDQGLECLSALSRWGESTVTALQTLAQHRETLNLAAVLDLQDFVLGGGEGREAATEALARLDVPVLKLLHLSDRTAAEYRLSDDGVPWDSVHYRIAMPELQGQSQPFVVAVAGPEQRDPRTGITFHHTEVLRDEVRSLAARLAGWARLADKPKAQRRVAIVYYNHPPGRHNVGADNLDVPASLWDLLHLLKGAGYDVRNLPASQKALLDAIQRRGINLPEDARALAEMADQVATLPKEDYARYFAGLPERARRTLQDGPLAAIFQDVRDALDARLPEVAHTRVGRGLGDVQHLLEGADHRARERALDLLEQLQTQYGAWIGGAAEARDRVERLTAALTRTGIEGLRGWGAPPGDVMAHGGELLVPGIELGNVFIGPQPPRGWELNEELLHANLAFPPTHQYLAYYHYLRDVWKADVVVHLGRHSTYEFLPGKRVGLTRADFPRLTIGDLPCVYIYIVDGVGEGIQAKRRGQAVIVDHLTPSLSTTPLYDELLELRQLVESFEAHSGGGDRATTQRAVVEIRKLLEELDLKDQLAESMRGELEVRGIGFDEVDDELLVHEVGHYLTELQERFMPFGLHVFGRDWEKPAVQRMLASMAGDGEVEPAWRSALTRSPRDERQALLAALDGRFIRPGHGNDPVRTPHALPTGRNFHALDGGLIPTRVAYALGADLAARARARGRSTPEGSEAVVLWASDTVRDEGAMVAFGLDMLGVRPTWNSRGILGGLERLPLAQGRVRRDVSFVTSGLFRDLYGNLLVWLDRAVLLALDGSSRRIAHEHPELAEALAGALAPLGELRAPGDEPLAANEVASHWVAEAKALLEEGDLSVAEAGRAATYRLFGNAPGGYGAGINRLAERSGSWQARDELADAYLRRMGHAYGVGLNGEPAHARFRSALSRTEHTFLGRASNLYGLLDNNDGFDYLGGLGMAVEEVRGNAPEASVVQHADVNDPRLQSLDRALMQELRGRHLNPSYLESLMEHGYAGARTMSAGFVENLWGWQVTSPEVVKPWAWDEVQRVFLDDGHDIGLDTFLAEGQNVHVRTNIQAVLLVAALKGFWSPSEQTLDGLSRDFARAIVEHGPPGSGHTRPDHPVMELVAARLDPELRAQFEARLEAAKVQRGERPEDPAHIRELEAQAAQASDMGATTAEAVGWSLSALAAMGALLWLGYRRGRGGPSR